MGIRLGVIAKISPEHSRDWVRTMPSEVSMSSAGNDREPTVEELKRELAESHRREAATAEVLKVISRSKFDLQPVLDTIARIASRLCAAENVTIFLREHTDLRSAAHHGSLATRLNAHIPVGRGWVAGRAVVDRQPIQVPDLTVAGDEFPLGREHAVKFAHRTSLGIPLLRDDAAIGCLLLRRRVVQPFDEKQIALLQTFADQAVIAIENTRLFEAEQASKRELQQSLEYQAATGEVLGVISRSPTDVQPVFNTIARSAAELCKVQFCHMFRFDGALIHFVASHGLSPKEAEAMRTKYPIPPGRASAAARSILTATVEEIPDVDADSEFEHGDIARLMNYRSIVAVPMTKDSRPVGAIVLMSSHAGAFPDRQIDLLKTFADQAVVAIENTRLFEEVQARTRELQEALEQQTATTDVLQVISSSPGELQPVFDGILSNATRVCGANFGNLFLCEGEVFRHVAMFGAPPEFAEMRQGKVVRPAPNSILYRITTAKQPQHILDFREEQSYLDQSPTSVQLVEIAGARTVLGVPLISANKVIGIIAIYRRHVEAFTDSK